ncbi:MAG: ClbS/DfsB family four-helix bundle protein [Chloroflexota bacterium]
MDPSLEELQSELSLAYISFFKVVEQLEPDKRNQPGASGHWSPKDIISHLIGWDTSLQRFISNPDGFDPTPLYDTDAFNAKSVLERKHQSWEETVNELQSSYRNMQEMISTVTSEMKIYNRVSDWLKGRKADYEFHTSQIEKWIN